MAGNLHSFCIPTNLFLTPIARKDTEPYQLSTINARGKKEINTTTCIVKLRPLSIYPFSHRLKRRISGSPHPSCRLRAVPRCIAGPGGESGVSASGRSDALAWAVTPKRGRESGGLGGLGFPCPKGKLGRGSKSRFEFLLSASPILIRDLALQIEGEIPHAGFVNALRGLARPIRLVSGSLSCHRHDGPPSLPPLVKRGESFIDLYIVHISFLCTIFCVKSTLKICY